jgi:NAD-dependent dihydropyrimidine dehydrogenase PreA subunit
MTGRVGPLAGATVRLVEVHFNGPLAYIICEPCVGTKDTACVDVCPVDCIHPRKDEPEFSAAEMLYIHPDECIDCGACVPACPVEAIYSLDETPGKWTSFIAKNEAYYRQ